MKNVILFTLIVLAVTACKKEKKYWCDEGKGDYCSACLTSDYENPNAVASNIEVYELKPLVTDPNCNCIVSGYVKYLKDGITVALVDYGEGDCDGYAVKTLCVNGDCEDKNAECCKFQQQCNN